jgi:hypothetical protein
MIFFEVKPPHHPDLPQNIGELILVGTEQGEIEYPLYAIHASAPPKIQSDKVPTVSTPTKIPFLGVLLTYSIVLTLISAIKLVSEPSIPKSKSIKHQAKNEARHPSRINTINNDGRGTNKTTHPQAHNPLYSGDYH